MFDTQNNVLTNGLAATLTRRIQRGAGYEHAPLSSACTTRLLGLLDQVDNLDADAAKNTVHRIIRDYADRGDSYGQTPDGVDHSAAEAHRIARRIVKFRRAGLRRGLWSNHVMPPPIFG